MKTYYIPMKKTDYGRMIITAETPEEAIQKVHDGDGEFDDSYYEQIYNLDNQWEIDENEVIIDEDDLETPIQEIKK